MQGLSAFQLAKCSPFDSCFLTDFEEGMLLVKSLGGGEGREFVWAPTVLIRSQKKNIPVSRDFPMELIKTLNVL